jgi:hypothetical protein
LIADKSCIYCGYDLTGLSAQDVCPKCGKPAGYSLLGDHLRDVESTWLKQIVLGLDVLTGSYIVLVGVRLMTLIALLDPPARYIDATFIRFFLAITGWLSFVVGVFLITRPETSGSMIARRRNIAHLLLFTSIIYTAVEFVPKNLIWENAKLPGLIAAVGISSLTLALCQSLLWLQLRRTIIDRTPRREVARKLNLGYWISLALFILFSDGIMRLLNRYLAIPDSAFLAFNLSVCGLMIVHHAFAIYLLIATRKAIRRTVGYWDS